MVATDATGKTSGISLSDNVQVVNGVSGNAIYLAELSYAFLTIGKTLEQFTISFWRKWDNITDTGYQRYIFYLSSDFYAYFDSTDNYLVLKMPSKDSLKTTILDNENNNHFCLTYKSGDKINLCINGVSVYNVTAESLSVDFSVPFYFGKTDAKAHATFDEIRFYGKVITDQEIAGLYRMIAKGYSSKSMQSVVATTAPKYLGIGLLAGTSIAKFTGATVSSTGVITIGDSVSPNVGDFMVNYSTNNAPLGIYIWSGSLWSTTSDVSKLALCAVDLINLNIGGITVDSYTVYTAAIIKSLFSQFITVLDPGYIKSSNYSDGLSGFKIGSDGNAEFNDISISDAHIDGSYYGLPTKIGDALAISLTNASVFCCALTSSEIVISRNLQDSTGNKLVRLSWNGSAFEIKGSWYTGWDNLGNIISTDENTIFCVATQLYNGSTYVASNVLVKLVFNPSTLVWSRSAYSLDVIGGALAYDGTNIYALSYYTYNSSPTIRCQVINKNTMNIIATTYLTIECTGGIDLSIQYIKDNLFVITHSRTGDGISERYVSLLYINPETFNMEIKSSYIFPYTSLSEVINKPTVVAITTTDYAVIANRYINVSGTYYYRREINFFKKIDSQLVFIHRINMKLSITSATVGCASLIGGNLALIDRVEGSAVMYHIGYTIGRPIIINK